MTKEKNLNIEKIFNLALVNHKENKFENAEKHYKQLLKIDPTHFNATYLLGTLFFQQNKLKDAKKIFESAMLINAGHAELCNNYGATLTQLGEYKSAINILQKAIYINPNYAEAYNNLGAALRELREETGYGARKIFPLSAFWAAPGWSTEYFYGFLLQDLFLCPSDCDEDEDIEVIRVPWDRIPELIKTGEIQDAKSIASLLCALYLH